MSHEHQNTNPRTKKQFDHSVPLFFLPAGLEMKKPHSEANLLLLATNPCITIHLFTLKERPPHRNSGTNFEFGPKTSVVGPLFPRQSIAPVSSSNNGELDAFFCVYRNPVPEDFLWKGVQTPVSLALRQPSPLTQGIQSLYHQIARWNISFTPKLCD